MKKKNPVLGLATPQVSRPSTAFDRGFRSNFTLSAGMLIPLFTKFVPAGTKFKLNRSVFLRTNAVNTAAFGEMNFNIDFYRVPMKLLVSNWGVIMTQTDDINSTRLTKNGSVLTPSTSIPSAIPLLPSSSLTAALNSSTFLGEVNKASRLMDYFNFGNVRWNIAQNNVVQVNDNGIAQNMLAPCAYQKIYFDHYRNTLYEANDPFAYNLDDVVWSGNWSSLSSSLNTRIKHILTLRHVNYRNDYFGNIYPSLYGYSSALTSNRSVLMPTNILGYGETSGGLSGPAFYYGSSSVYPQIPSDVTGSTSPLEYSQNPSVQNIRAAFALDKLLRLSSRTKQHVVDQYAARFGVAPKNESMNESIYLGSFSNDIQIGEVLQSVNTDTQGSTNLGAVGGVGRGAAPREKSISGFCDSDSIIMGIAYVIPKRNYDSFFVDAFNVKSLPSDYFQPEFENLGLQPLSLYQMNSSIVGIPTQGHAVANTTKRDSFNNLILGYQPRYSEYKISVDENHSEFNTGGSLSAFVTHTNRIIPETDGVSAEYFKVYPGDLDSLFVENVNSASLPIYDQFFGTVHFDFDVVQKMSALGEPSI